MFKKLASISLVIFLIFVGLGDKFLPEPLKGMSSKTRTSINQLVIGLFPKKEFKNPHQRTEDALEQQEQQQKK